MARRIPAPPFPCPSNPPPPRCQAPLPPTHRYPAPRTPHHVPLMPPTPHPATYHLPRLHACRRAARPAHAAPHLCSPAPATAVAAAAAAAAAAASNRPTAAAAACYAMAFATAPAPAAARRHATPTGPASLTLVFQAAPLDGLHGFRRAHCGAWSHAKRPTLGVEPRQAATPSGGHAWRATPSAKWPTAAAAPCDAAALAGPGTPGPAPLRFPPCEAWEARGLVGQRGGRGRGALHSLPAKLGKRTAHSDSSSSEQPTATRVAEPMHSSSSKQPSPCASIRHSPGEQRSGRRHPAGLTRESMNQ